MSLLKSCRPKRLPEICRSYPAQYSHWRHQMNAIIIPKRTVYQVYEQRHCCGDTPGKDLLRVIVYITEGNRKYSKQTDQPPLGIKQ